MKHPSQRLCDLSQQKSDRFACRRLCPAGLSDGNASNLLNDKGTTNDTWRTVLGNEFPKDSEAKSVRNELICACASHRQKIPWSLSRGSAVIIALRAEDADGNLVPYESNGTPLEKDITLHFKALTAAKRPYTVMWQITNTGEEATKENCLRGDFYPSDEGTNGRRESTSYTGSHSVQCFVIKNRICVAKSRDFIINIRKMKLNSKRFCLGDLIPFDFS